MLTQAVDPVDSTQFITNQHFWKEFTINNPKHNVKSIDWPINKFNEYLTNTSSYKTRLNINFSKNLTNNKHNNKSM